MGTLPFLNCVSLLAFLLAAPEITLMYSLLLRKVQAWRSEKRGPELLKCNSNLVVLNWRGGGILPPGDTWRCLEIPLIAMAEGRYWHFVGRSQRYYKTSYNPKQPSTTKKPPGQNGIVPLLISLPLNVPTL